MARYSRNQEIVLMVLAVVAVVTIAFCTVWGSTRGKDVESYAAVTEDVDTVRTDSVAERKEENEQWERRYPRKEPFRFEINGVGMDELMKFPGIAEGRAGAITGYRERLGGYYSLDQLLEIRVMNDTIVNEIKKWAWVEEDSIKKIDVESATVATLRRHPYINYYQAREIDSIRWVCKKRGEKFSMDSCKIVFGDDWSKVKKYLK